MPPKKKGPSGTQVKKAKDKIVEDKTFGLKNKSKSKKVQQYVTQVKQQADKKMEKYEKGRNEAKAKRDAEKEDARQQLLMNQMFKVAIEPPKLAPGVDPKSVLCPFFKAGQCTRGDKCKYSHDEQVGRKGAKLDIYQDRRETETNENWDEDTLRKVVTEKHQGQKCQSTIICKYFLEAVREKKYGWFWECPNGETCHYKHALPAGYVLETKKKKADDEEEEEETPLEDILEVEREKLKGTGTPVTLERFNEWKTEREKRRQAAHAAQAEQREREIAAGRAVNLTGRELLQFRPELFQDEDPGEDFDYAALRAQLLAEEDEEAGASVQQYNEETKDLDLMIDESLFSEPPPDLDGPSNNNNNNNNEEEVVVVEDEK